MENIQVKINPTPGSSYPILIGENLLDNPYELIKNYTRANRFLVVTNEKVFSLYGSTFDTDFAEVIVLPDGEEYKNREVLGLIIDKALKLKIERKDAIIALGGGVIGDMAGFAAAIYQRGIDYIQVPTTLLAQVDSSVGGKVAVNHKLSKNVIGSFYQPKLVIADTNTLNTLDDRQFKTGLSEVLKYAFIEKSCKADVDYHFFEFLETHRNEIFSKNHEVLKKLIKICCLLKSSVVNKDEKEKGLRAILNFGHTYAHALEIVTDYRYFTHGEAVSIGMKIIFDLALETGTINRDYYNRATKLLSDYNLVTDFQIKLDEELFYDAMKSDKKVSDGNINFVMPVGFKEVAFKNNIDKKHILSGI